MLLKMNNLKFIIKKSAVVFAAVFYSIFVQGQVPTTTDSIPTPATVKDSVTQGKEQVEEKVEKSAEAVADTAKDSLKTLTQKGVVIKEALVDSVNTVTEKKIVPYEELEDAPAATTAEIVASQNFEKIKVDGVAAVIGKYVVLDSDVDKAYIELKSQGISTEDVSRCELAGSLLENKLYAHHAVQDSIPVSDAEIEDYVDKQVSYMKEQIGTEEKMLAFYKKDNMQDFKKELFEINKNNRLSQEMQKKVVEEVEITPEEVRDFFKKIPEEDRPLFGTEIEIAQIVIEPKVPEAEVKKVLDKLNQYRTDVVENGASFATKAVLYSKDPGSRSSGGKYTISRQDPFAKEFKDAAFSLQEGEVSEPFKTDFGYHILTVDKIRGQQVDVRHILLIPDVTEATIKEAKKRVDSIRSVLAGGQVKFADIARRYSDEKETRQDGGQLINPTTGDTRFELSKIDPLLYEQVSKLKSGEISKIIPDQDRTGKKKFKIITVTNRYDEHVADYAKDYIKIQELALKEKQLKAVEEWQKEKIDETYIKINGEYRECDYTSNWLKK